MKEMISRKLLLCGCLFLVKLVNFVQCNGLWKLYCPDDAAYDPDTTNGRAYSQNLNSLLTVLISNASQPRGFYNYTAGAGGESALYGLFLCRGDINSSDCEDCLITARTDMLPLCPNKNWAIAWYDYCMLRYSTDSVFSKLDFSIGGYLTNPGSVSDLVSFNQVLADTFNQIATRAASGGEPQDSRKKFAVQDAKFTASQRLYALGQCTPDLSSFDCESCLRNTISQLPSCCLGSRSAVVFEPSCSIRYELYQFYNQVLPLRLLPPPLQGPATADNKEKGKRVSITTTSVLIAVPIIAGIAMFAVVIWVVKKARKSQKIIQQETSGVSCMSTDDAESLHYSFVQIQECTNNFRAENRIGEGGFGPVYKGTLPNGQMIAVKRLSIGSNQGTQEFINEIGLVAKLHHRNLVRLLGYCLEGEEKLLIYEYIPNRSLDHFLFDLEKQSLLNWITRYNIIRGIARGLLYLHEDSRINIIHRDLKASNILLDRNMNPKIADFGMARLFDIDQSKARTAKIAGTFGYMAPEYVMRGIFSVKSDVFSFGVLVLEILSGKSNYNFLESHGGDRDDLLRYSWRQWRNGTPLAILDPSIGESCNRQEVMQCIHIGLLCVQKEIELRPTMTSVVLMLNSYSVTLPAPNPPAFFDHGHQPRTSPSEPPAVAPADPLAPPESSRNEASISELQPR